MSHARWTLSPIVEREAERGVRRLRRERTMSSVAVGLALTVGVALVLVGLAATAGNGFLFATALAIFAGGGIFGTLVALDRRRIALRTRETALLAPMREEFGSGAGTLVRLRVLQGDAPTGDDVGMLWIDEGRLLFAGRRTSFALGPGGVRGPCRAQPALAGLRHPVRVALRERTAAGPLALSLEPIDVDADRLIFEIDRWARTIGPPGQLPPMAVGPDAPSPARLLAGAAYATAYWGLAWAAVVLSHGGLVVLLLFAAILASRTGASAPFVRWRAFRDRRRVG